MAYTRVKICGITRPEDAAVATECGADYVGLNFVGGPRKIAVAEAPLILAGLPDTAGAVALLPVVGSGGGFAGAVYDLQRTLGIQHFQLYGWRSDLYGVGCDPFRNAFDQPIDWWLVAPVEDREVLRLLPFGIRHYDRAKRPTGVVLDTAVHGQLGGTGRAFDWNWIAEVRAAGELEGLPPIILAGGLTPENVAEAIRIVQPYAVDVSSGVEIAGKPGIKDPIKVRDFIQAAKGAL